MNDDVKNLILSCNEFGEVPNEMIASSISEQAKELGLIEGYFTCSEMGTGYYEKLTKKGLKIKTLLQ